MTDNVSRQKRREMMRGIRSSGTEPEKRVAAGLRSRRFRLGSNAYRHGFSFKPDFILPKFKTAVFVNGCFWHRHLGCKIAYEVKVESAKGQQDWKRKFDANIRRDKRNIKETIDLGWRALVIWECATRKREILESCLDEAAEWIHSGDTYIEYPTESSG